MNSQNLNNCSEQAMTADNLECMREQFDQLKTAKYMRNIAKRGSCGKCTPCRESMPRVRVLIEKLNCGTITNEEHVELMELAHLIEDTALCFSILRTYVKKA